MTSDKLYNGNAVEWRRSEDLVDFRTAEEFMIARAADIASGEAKECIWLLEHPPLYTAGTSANINDLVEPDRFDVFKTGRGGQYTYHGPGQRVAYVMLDLRKRGRDVSAFVKGLEQWVIDTLAEFNITAERRCGRVGVWVVQPDGREDKIAAIGVRLKKWVSFHGISINLNPDLSHFSGIVPCGISEHGVTSFQNLDLKTSMAELDAALKTTFEQLFSPIIEA